MRSYCRYTAHLERFVEKKAIITVYLVHYFYELSLRFGLQCVANESKGKQDNLIDAAKAS